MSGALRLSEQDKKEVISETEWKKQMQDISISKADMNKLIMNFFIVEGYKDAAKNFREESLTEVSDQDLEQMQPRIDVRQLVLEGKIDEAIDKLNQVNKKILVQNEELQFNVKLQKCIEYIRNNKVDEAIMFAQQELLPLIESNNGSQKQQNSENMEKAISLLAFEDLNECPYKDLASNSQRIKISSQINYEMLQGLSSDKENKLPTLIKLMLWSQQKLYEKMKFPQIQNVTTGGFKSQSQSQQDISNSKQPQPK